MLAGVAEFERELISERTKAGLARARACGKQLGRPRVSVDAQKVKDMRKKGYGYRKIAKTLGVSHQTILNRQRKEGVNRPNGDP